MMFRMKHHYVPKFYLKRWADSNGQILRYRRLPTGRIASKALAPEAVGYQKDLYRAPYDDDRQAYELEVSFFQSLDVKSAEALEELTKPGIRELPSEALQIWWHFILGLLHRSPAYFANVQRVGQRHYRAALQRLERDYPARRAETDPLTFAEFAAQSDERELKRRLFRLFPQLTFNQNILRHMSEMHWFAVDAADDSHLLLLSDDPLLRSNGLKAPDGHLATALSPSRLLIGTHTAEYAAAIRRMRRKDIFARMNLATVAAARTFVVARDERQGSFIEKHFGSKLRPPLAHDGED